ncbi:TlpA family protein disulfide reductase [Congregibacter sp.]|uniref:TlpA family protein disulfide reductase n=1 Tax=Congregibacter sp. TaxID=2744308 RepID=UPI003F6B7731
MKFRKLQSARLFLLVITLMPTITLADPVDVDVDVGGRVWHVVNYWSEWCSPCRKEIPMLNVLSTELDPLQAKLVGVNFDDHPHPETIKIALKLGITFPSLTRAEVQALNLPLPDVMPTTYIVSPKNELVLKLIGLQSRDQLLKELSQLGIRVAIQ